MTADTGTSITVRAPKNLDACTIAAFRASLREAVGRLPSEVVADLEGTEFMDANGLGVLVGALRHARAHDVHLAVVCTREPVLRLFRITGLAKVLDIRSGNCETPAPTETED